MLCLTETWETPAHMKLDIDGMRLIVSKARVGRGGGVAIYAGHSVDAVETSAENNEGLQHAAIKVKMTNGYHDIHVMYRRPADQLEILQGILERTLTAANYKITIVGDMNVDWLGTETRTRNWKTMIGSLGLKNQVTEPTRCGIDRDSCIDHVYTNHDETIEATAVDLHLADHKAVLIALDNHVKKRSKKKEVATLLTAEGPVALLRLHLRNTDWDELYVQGGSTEANFRRFHDTITSLVTKHCMKNVKIKTKKPEWQDREYEKGWQDMAKAAKKKKKTAPATPERATAIDNYRRVKARFQNLARKKLHAYYAAKLRGADPKETWRLMNQIMRRGKDAHDIAKIEVNGQEVTDDEEIAWHLNKFYCNIGAKLANSIPATGIDPGEGWGENDGDTEMTSRPVTTSELVAAATKMQNKTSTSYDGLSNKLFKMILPEIEAPLTKLINDIFTTGTIPQIIKRANAIYLKKKPQAKQLGDFRPISLVPVMMKIIDKMFSTRLNAHMEANMLWAEAQHGYLKGKSTATALLEINLEIQREVKKGNKVALIMLDSSKAFDTVKVEILIEKAKKYGVTLANLVFMENYIKGRTQVSIVGESKSTEEIKTIGVPQGGNLSCLAFIMYNNDLPQHIKDAFITMFSDDTSLVVSAPTAEELEKKANAILKRVAVWFATSKLTLNEDKSNYIIYGTKKPVKLRMTQAGLKQIETGTARLLGVDLQPDGKYAEHAEKILGKLASAGFILRQVKNKLPKHLKILVYRALLESHLRYALPLWGPTMGLTLIKRFETAQKKGLRAVEGLPYNAHTAGLFQKYNILKFNDLIRVEMQLLMYGAATQAVPPRLTRLLTGDTPERTGLRADTQDRARRATTDPPLLNALKAAWNVLQTDQRQASSRDALKASLRITATVAYGTDCTRQDCTECRPPPPPLTGGSQ